MLRLRTKRMGERLILGSVLVVALSVLAGCPATNSDNGDAAPDSDGPAVKLVKAEGKILPLEGFYRLAAVGPVKEVHVKIGDSVEAGKVLVTMQAIEGLKLQVRTANQQLAEAKQQLLLSETKARQMVQAAELKLQQVDKKRELLEEDQAELMRLAKEQVDASEQVLARLQDIADDELTGEFVGKIEIDRQKVAIQEAKLQYEQQLVSHKQALGELDFAEQLAKAELASAQESLKAARESKAVEIAQSKIDLLKKQIQAAKIRAPKNGVITGINVRAGESSVQLPVIEMANLEELVCEVEINELDAGRVHEGDPAVLRSRAFKDQELLGEVKRKSRVVGRPQLKPFDPLAPVDYRTVTAVIDLYDQFDEIAGEWLELQVEVAIEVRPNESEGSTSGEGDSAVPSEAESPQA